MTADQAYRLLRQSWRNEFLSRHEWEAVLALRCENRALKDANHTLTRAVEQLFDTTHRLIEDLADALNVPNEDR